MFGARHRSAALAASVLTIVGLVGVGLASAAGADPAPELYVAGTVYHASPTPVDATNLVAGQQYTLTATAGTWSNGESSVTDLSDQYGRIDDALTLPYSADPALTSITVTLALAADPTSTLATDTGAVAKPFFGDLTGLVCVGHSVFADTFNFPDGTYTLASADATITPSTTSATQGQIGNRGSLVVRIAADAPRHFPITATTGAGANRTVFSYRITRKAAHANIGEPGTPWQPRLSAGCFAPRSHITIGQRPAYVDLPKSLTTDAGGNAAATVTLHPKPKLTTVPRIAITGPYSQEAHTSSFTLYGTTLRTGAVVDDSNELLSSQPGYELAVNACNPTVYDYGADGRRHAIWQARPKSKNVFGCTLRLRPNGTLALKSPSGALVWQTHTKGSAGGNRLVMRKDGAATVIDAHGTPVWSTEAGRLG